MDVLAPADLSAAQRSALGDLIDRRTATDGHPALPEPQQSVAASGALAASSLRVLLAYDDAALLGAAVLSPAADGSALHLVVDPALDGPTSERPDEVTDALMAHALAEPEASGLLRLWAMRATPDDDTRARRHGFAPERDLLQMRVSLPLPAERTANLPPLATRPFDPDRDMAAWLDVNNRAFAGHPEQGEWTEAQLRQRLAAPWVDLNGFLMADAPDGGGLIGSCWTKIHGDSQPVLGEIYVISVDPDRHSHGWGKALTVAGLEWLGHQGIAVGMLYTDASNTAAVKLYTSLGFTIDHIDRSYVRATPA